jgi:hypothetical protein
MHAVTAEFVRQLLVANAPEPYDTIDVLAELSEFRPLFTGERQLAASAVYAVVVFFITLPLVLIGFIRPFPHPVSPADDTDLSRESVAARVEKPGLMDLLRSGMARARSHEAWTAWLDALFYVVAVAGGLGSAAYLIFLSVFFKRFEDWIAQEGVSVSIFIIPYSAFSCNCSY